MQIVVTATDEQWEGLTTGREQVEWLRVNSIGELVAHPEAGAYFILDNAGDNNIIGALSKPVFINSVTGTLSSIQAPQHVFRINGWNSFLDKTTWEIAGEVNDAIKEIFSVLNIKLNAVKDEPGFVSARVISMIINEAYFALEEKVSSKPEIDTAMKLGTNYPHGPFEWVEKIGKKQVLELLQVLYKTDARYKPADLLIKEAGSI